LHPRRKDSGLKQNEEEKREQGIGVSMRRLTKLVVSLGLLGFLVGCGHKPSRPSRASGGGPGTGGDPGQILDDQGNPINPASDVPMQASLASFSANVYEPILGRYCSNCHAETFAAAPGADGTSPSLEKNHAEFLKRSNFNAFAGVDHTLPVTKMDYKTGGHNCWESEPKKCYDKMTLAMNAWLKDLSDAGYKPKPIQYPNTTETVALASAAPATVVVDSNNYVAMGVDKATLAAPFTMATDDGDGPIKAYAMSPDTTAPGGNNANQAQSITFNMDIKQAGTYYLWMRVKTKAAANSRFFAQAGAGAIVQVNPGATTDWKWVQATTVANNVTTPYSLAVAAPGPQPVRVFYRDPGARINQVVLTQRKDDFNGDQFVYEYKEIKVPLKVAGADGASIVATVWEQTKSEGKKSLGVTSLKIMSPVPLKVKNIKPLINGLFYSNHATYTIVDTVAGGPNPEIKTGGSTASTWLADIAVDKLSFSFETIEVAK